MVPLCCVLDSRHKESQTQYVNSAYQANKIPVIFNISSKQEENINELLYLTT